MITHVFQEHEAFCGPAVVQMVMARFGVTLTQQDIAKELETDMVVGTSARELEKFFKQRGRGVVCKNDTAWDELSNALTVGLVIVGYVEREGDPHYALVHSVSADQITLADPWHGDKYVLPRAEFEERWKDNEAARYGHRMFMVVTDSTNA